MSKFIWNHSTKKKEYTAGRVADAYTKGETDAKIEEAVEPFSNLGNYAEKTVIGHYNGKKVIRQLFSEDVITVGGSAVFAVENYSEFIRIYGAYSVGDVNRFPIPYSDDAIVSNHPSVVRTVMSNNNLVVINNTSTAIGRIKVYIEYISTENI